MIASGGIKAIRRSLENGDLAKARLFLKVSKNECRVLKDENKMECEKKVFDIIDSVGTENAEKMFNIADGKDTVS